MLTRRRTIAGLGSIGIVAAASPRRMSAQGGRLIGLHSAFKPIPIAIAPFIAGAPSENEIAGSLSQIVTNNLRRSGLFAPIDPSAFVEHIADFDKVPQFESWKLINAEALVTGRVTRQSDGRLKVELRLWDVAAGRQLVGQQFVIPPGPGRRIAHIISDLIFVRMTGEAAYFDSRIAFVDESGPPDRRIRKLALMDQDGANLRYLTSGADPVSKPRFSPSGQDIIYMESGSGEPNVCLLNIETGTRKVIDGLQGIPLSSPRFSPDGQRIVFAVKQGEQSNVFAMHLASRATERLTETPASDTSPSYSPDGSQLCFESDRGGKPQIYVMPANGGEAQRISFGEGTYRIPVWSPHGDMIAFTKRKGDQSATAVIKPDGSGERILTAGFHDEGPTFAPNGRVLMFFRDPGGAAGPSLFTIDVNGRNELKQPTPGYASDPAWSPLLS